MVGADTDFVLSTKHSAALHTTQFAALDGEALVAIVQLGTNDGGNHLLPGSHIRSAADNLKRFLLTNIDGADVHVVAVRVRFASQHFGHPKTFQTTLDGLHFLHAIHFETSTGQGICYLLCAQRRIDILLKPFV